MKRLRILAAASATLLTGLLASTPAHAASGTILLPCVHPAVTRVASIDVQHASVCGAKIQSVVPGGYFNLSAAPKADLDIYFYQSSNTPTNSYAHLSCANESGFVPADASFAIVVLSPSTCGANANVGFTYP
ncbi:MAG: hypothetical protein ABR548_13680 [Actinomycetota bacterium]|nr:hypothetical protein [Actinomycetota bacterium]